jgi:hypothetical protein
MKTIQGHNKQRLYATVLKLFVFLLCICVVCFLFTNNAMADNFIKDIRDDSFWTTAGNVIGEFYSETYELVMSASGEFAWDANSVLSKSTNILLGMGFGIWLLGFIGINVFASVTNASIMKIVPAVLTRGMVVMAVAIILGYNGDNTKTPIFKELLRPFAVSSYKLGATYLATNSYDFSSVSDTDFDFATCSNEIGASYSDTNPVLPASVAADRAVYLNDMKPGAASQNMFTADMVLYGGCLLRQVAYSVSALGIMGTAMVLDSMDVHFMILMHVLEFMAGICICVSCCWLLLMVPIYLLDSVFKAVIFAACFPILFVLWAFPLTRDYFMRGLYLFINSCLHVIFMCIILGFCINTMGTFADSVGIFDVINNADSMSNVREDYANFTKAGFTALLIMPWMTVIMVEKAEGFADFFCAHRASGLDSSAHAFRRSKAEVSTKVTHYTPKVLAMAHKRHYGRK